MSYQQPIRDGIMSFKTDKGRKDVRRRTNRRVKSGQWQLAEKGSRFKVESWQYGFGIHLNRMSTVSHCNRIIF